MDNILAEDRAECSHTPLFAQDPVRWVERVTPCLYCRIERLVEELVRVRNIATRIVDARERDHWNDLDDAVDDLLGGNKPHGKKTPAPNSPEDIQQSMNLLQQIHREAHAPVTLKSPPEQHSQIALDHGCLCDWCVLQRGLRAQKADAGPVPHSKSQERRFAAQKASACTCPSDYPTSLGHIASCPRSELKEPST